MSTAENLGRIVSFRKIYCNSNANRNVFILVYPNFKGIVLKINKLFRFTSTLDKLKKKDK